MDGKIVTPGQSCVDARRLVLGVIHILVVDDDPVCLAIVAAVLRACKYNVMSVKNSMDALSILRTNRGLIDLVITDVHMPGMNGFELQKFIDEEFKLPVIMMSADSRENIMFKGLEGGASFFMVKPIKKEDVRDLWQFAVAKKKGKAPINIAEEAVNSDPEVSPFAWKKASRHDDNIVLGSSSSSTNQGKGENQVRKKREYKRRTPKKSIVSTWGVNDASKTIKKAKVIWTTTLHSRFLLAIQDIGLTKCVPKRILEVMSVPGLTRENVASHLQKYRIFLKRVSNTSDETARKMVERVLLRSSFAPRHASSFFNSFQQNYANPARILPNINQEASRSPFATNSSQANLLLNNHIYQPSNFSRLGLINHPNGIRIGDVSSPNVNRYSSNFTMNNGPNNLPPMHVSNIGTNGLITTSANTIQGLMMNRNNSYTTNGFGAENNIGSSSNNPIGSNYMANNSHYGHAQGNNYGGQFGNNDHMLGRNYVGYQEIMSNGGFVPNNVVQQSEEEDDDDGIDYSNVFGFIDNYFATSKIDFSQPWNDERLNAMFLAEINGNNSPDEEGDEEAMEPDLFVDPYHVEVPEDVVQPLNQPQGAGEEVNSFLADDILKWFDLQPPNEDELGEEFVNSVLNGMNRVGDDEVEDPFDWVDVADDPEE